MAKVLAGIFVILKLFPPSNETIFLSETFRSRFSVRIYRFLLIPTFVCRVTVRCCFSAVMDALLGDISRKSAVSS